MTTEKRIVKAGLLGLGTVGSGVLKALRQNGESIAARTGCRIEIPYVLVRDPLKKRNVTVEPERIVTDPNRVLNDREIEIVIEVMGGVEPARSIILKALRSGKHVITANKELLAKHGAELLHTAEESGVQLLFEASVAGGIPVIRFLQGYLTANRVHEVAGILNGTTNYILTQMEQTGQSFQEVLGRAQELGYAEADPTSDVEGYDAAYKLAILTNLAFDVKVPVHEIRRQGITDIEPLDLQWAREFGYIIKLLGRSRQTAQGIDLSVGPRLLPLSHPLARVNDVFNAVTISSDVVGDLTFIGKGAGEYPTASAVLEDLTALLQLSGKVLRSSSWTNPLQPFEAANELQSCFVRMKVSAESVLECDRLFFDLVKQLDGTVLHEASAAGRQEMVRGFVVAGISPKVLVELLQQSLSVHLPSQPVVIPGFEEPPLGTQEAFSPFQHDSLQLVPHNA